MTVGSVFHAPVLGLSLLPVDREFKFPFPPQNALCASIPLEVARLFFPKHFLNYTFCTRTRTGKCVASLPTRKIFKKSVITGSYCVATKISPPPKKPLSGCPIRRARRLGAAAHAAPFLQPHTTSFAARTGNAAPEIDFLLESHRPSICFLPLPLTPLLLLHPCTIFCLPPTFGVVLQLPSGRRHSLVR